MKPAILFLCLAAPLAGPSAAATRVLFLSGPDSHGWDQHKHRAGSRILCDAMNETPGIEAKVVTEWPSAEDLASADTLVIYADGWHAHPANGRLAELEAHMNSGKGLVALHWATGIQAADPEAKEQGADPQRVKWRELMGADFEAYHSISNFWSTDYRGDSTHPVMRGVKPFSLYDECYYHLRECADGCGKVEPVFTVNPPPETIEPGLSPYRGNDKARSSVVAKKEAQYVAWAFPRVKGGRAFGFTGGHFHWTWARDEVRKMVLNGILWSAGEEVPQQGLASKTPDAERMLAVLTEKKPGWSVPALQDALDRAAAGETVRWLDYTNQPLPEPPAAIFDGNTLDGWEVRPGEEKWWSVRDGMITGGSMDEQIPHNTFLASRKRYANFDLRLKVRLVKGSGFMNSGIQVRSIRVKDDHEMSGYQVDAGIDWWGKLYDESRRNRVIGEPVDPAALAAVVKDWDWNDYRILCEGRRIRTWINGVAALDFTEEDAAIPLEGRIGLQAHGGGKMLAQFKDIAIRELPPTAGAPEWEEASVRTPEKEMAAMTLPEGFEIELVASEKEGVGKPITVAWDHAGRMWTMTALEYPVDANENAAQAEALYARGGKDRVLVFDEPWKPGPQTPRVFAEGLAIPLGILPWRDGALVQYGREIRYYEDRNKDGKADGHRTILTGFGIQDSHLFPHQFERAPGGWFYLAQGLFNYSKVVRPDGAPFANGASAIDFNQCKLARAKLDGSDFELLTAGPNNIWGFAIGRDGREFLQEANDLGHPVSEFIAGAHYPTGSSEKLRPYAPLLPPSTPDQPMGGTGLSGLVVADDEGSAFAAAFPGKKVFYLANPITNRIQIVTLETDQDGRAVYRKQEDFLVSSDPWFRPVSVQFGPDGCLYVVDWCNKIISHNEVPRTHPDRDKTRGRIWRIKPKGASPTRPPDLTKLGSRELIAQLGAGNTRVARMAWQELGDRRDSGVVAELKGIATRGSEPLTQRLGALWALLEMGSVDAALVARLATDADPDLRREAAEAWGSTAGGDPANTAAAVRGEKDFAVRAAWANAMRTRKSVPPAMLTALAASAPAPAGAGGREGYESTFLRYLIRWAMESHPQDAEAILAGLPVEGRLLAAQAVSSGKGVAVLLESLADLARPLAADEAALLGAALGDPAVAKIFTALLADPARRTDLLKALLQLDPKAASDPALRETVGKAATAIAREEPAGLPLVLDLTRRFRLRELAPVLLEKARVTTEDAELSRLLRAMNEIQSADAALCRSHLDHADAAVQREALLGYASAGGAAAVEELGNRWPQLAGALRQFAVDGMLSRRDSAVAFAKAVAVGGFAGFDPSAVEKLAAVLGPDDPALREVLEKVDGLLARVVRLPGKQDAVIEADLTLDGPFTVETWVKLDAGIDNRDGLLGTRGGGPDINFYDARLRLWNGANDVVIADRPVEAGVWTHCAVSRDADGKISLHLDGEPAGSSAAPYAGKMQKLDLGRANQAGGTAGAFLDYRVWNRALTADEIRAGFRTRYPAGEMPAGMVHRFDAGDPGLKLSGGSVIEWTADFPERVTPAEARKLEEKFARFRVLAAKPGDATAGKPLFQATCMICHQVRGEGIAIGPDLGGAGAMGVESLLRNILTPNAQLESGYYRHDLTLKDGSLVSGFLASHQDGTLVIRQIGSDARAIPAAEVKQHVVSKRSLMPEGLIDGFSEQQVADLFAYLMTLR
jgi:putative membrane-bound dehydrogenase-like protein